MPVPLLDLKATFLPMAIGRRLRPRAAHVLRARHRQGLVLPDARRNGLPWCGAR
jgi:hypothetical protein